MVTTAEGTPVEVSLTSDNYNDTKHLRTFELDLPEGSVFYKASVGYFAEDLPAEASGIELLLRRKKNSKQLAEIVCRIRPADLSEKDKTGFSGLKRLLPASIHAVTDRGFELKIFLFMLACNIDVLL